MKMRTVKALACAAVMALALSATACGSKEADKAEDNATVENTDSEDQAADNADAEADNADAEAPADTEADNADAEAPADTEADASADGTALYSTLEEYYNDPAVKSVLDSAFESMGQDGMSLSIEVKGNVFSLTCKFEDSSMVADGVAEALEQGLEAAASQFETQAAAFDEAVGQSGACTVAVRYTDPDDNVLAEREFKAQ